MGNIFESRIIVNGPETEMARFKAQVGTVTPLGSREGYVPSPGEFAFRFDERAAPEYLYHHWVEGFPALTFDISVFRDDFDCLDYWTDANGKLVRGERWFAFRDGSRISAEEAQALDDRADAETSRFFDAIDQRPHNNPEIEATARNLDSYMRFRAEREDQRYDLSPQFFADGLYMGITGFFGVTVEDGQLIEDAQQPELFCEWCGETVHD
jgi:hypothetical protein